MSQHIASLVSFGFLSIAIVLTCISIAVGWWEANANAGAWSSQGAVTLWEIKFDVNYKIKNVAKGAVTWDNLCDFPSIDDDMKGTCVKIKAMRTFLIIGAIFSFFAAGGVAYGIYSGNTLISSGAGVVAGFSLLMTLVAVGLGFMIESEGLVQSPGFGLALGAGGLQLLGSILCCVGTCQEMHELASLAASLNIGPDKVDLAPKSRAEKSAKVRETEAVEAREIYQNTIKRMAQPKPESLVESTKLSQEGEDEEEAAPKKKVPIMLKKVLFRKPGPDGDDDEIPTKMLEDAFAEIDGDGSGSIDIEELVDALKLCDLPVSKNATEVIMKEIDKNASGDIDLREFIEFFRHIEDLNRFQKKSAARQQFLSFLLNFCFLADILVVGIMLMMFIRMNEADNPDNYSIMKNVLIACSVFLGILFLAVILVPILRLALGPTASRMQKQYEIAQEIKKLQRTSFDDNQDTGPREPGFGPDDPPPPVNAAMFGRSYRPGKVDAPAWAPPLEDIPPPNRAASASAQSTRFSDTTGRTGTTATGTSGSESALAVRQPSNSSALRASNTSMTLGGNAGGHGHGHGHHGGRSGFKRYDPANYGVANDFAYMAESQNMQPTTWSPMQVRETNMPRHTNPATLPGAPAALTDAAFPHMN